MPEGEAVGRRHSKLGRGAGRGGHATRIPVLLAMRRHDGKEGGDT